MQLSFVVCLLCNPVCQAGLHDLGFGEAAAVVCPGSVVGSVPGLMELG